MRDRGTRDGRRTLGGLAAVATAFAVVLGNGSAQAATEQLDEFGLISDGRGWVFESSSVFGYSEGYLVADRVGADAFDSALRLVIGGNTFGDEDNTGSFNPRTNTVTAGPTQLGELVVTRVETARGPYVRSFIRVRNTGAAAFSGTLEWNSDVGSDGTEVVQGSSSGDPATWEPADRWLVTSEPGATTFEDDPVLGFVLAGKGAPMSVSTIANGPGSGNIDAEFTLEVPAGKTRYVLFFTEMHGKPGKALSSMAKYDKRGLSATLLAGIPKKARKHVVNWDL